MVAEVVRVNVVPSPRNPFAVDHAFFDTLCPEERIIATGAMIYFLQRLLNEEHSYNSKGREDLENVKLRI